MFKLFKSVKEGATIIEGFPGLGLVATITTEFISDHLNCELIGKMFYDDIAPVTAIHNGNLVLPFSIYYSEKENIVIVHGLTSENEWKIAKDIIELYKSIKAKRIISLDGIFNPNVKEQKILFYSNDEEFKKELVKYCQELNDGIILGVTSALMILQDEINLNCLFAEVHSQLPDSKASSLIIEVLDKTLGLNVDIEPLLKRAETFERKLKEIIRKSMMASKEKEQKEMLSYLG